MPETIADRLFEKLLAATQTETAPSQRDPHRIEDLTKLWSSFTDLFNAFGNNSSVVDEPNEARQQELLASLREEIFMVEQGLLAKQLTSLHQELEVLAAAFPEEETLVNWLQTMIIATILDNTFDPDSFIAFIADWQSARTTHNLGRFIHDINKHLLIASLQAEDPALLLDQVVAYLAIDTFGTIPDKELEISLATLKNIFTSQLAVSTYDLDLSFQFQIETSDLNFLLSKDKIVLLNTFAYNMSLNSGQTYLANTEHRYPEDTREVIIRITALGDKIVISWQDFAGGFPATNQEQLDFTPVGAPILTFSPDKSRVNRGLTNLDQLAQEVHAELTMGTTLKIVDTYVPIENEYDEYGDPKTIRTQTEKRSGAITILSWKKN